MVWRLTYKNYRTPYLCYCPGLCKIRYLSHHVPIVFLRKQPIAECWTRSAVHACITRKMDDLRFRKKFNLGITKDISGKKLSKLEKLQSLVAKCCKIRKI